MGLLLCVGKSMGHTQHLEKQHVAFFKILSPKQFVKSKPQSDQQKKKIKNRLMDQIDPKGLLPYRRKKRDMEPVQPGWPLPQTQPDTQTGARPEKKQPGHQRKIVGGSITWPGKPQCRRKGILIKQAGKRNSHRTKAQPPVRGMKAKEKEKEPGDGAEERGNPVQ